MPSDDVKDSILDFLFGRGALKKVATPDPPKPPPAPPATDNAQDYLRKQIAMNPNNQPNEAPPVAVKVLAAPSKASKKKAVPTTK